MEKVILATRTKTKNVEELNAFVEKLEKEFGRYDVIEKIYVICNQNEEKIKIKKGNCEVIYEDNNKDPIRPTAFNVVLKKMKDDRKNGKYHLLTYSKEVDLREENIVEMINEIEKDKNNLIVVGYRLRDNVLSPEEQLLCDDTIAYKVPWNTCALWNKKFVYGEGSKRLKFDEICDKNNLGKLEVKVHDYQVITDYEGMEDGLAIAEIVTKNKGLRYKLIGDNYLSWWIDFDEKRRFKQKVKMARKSIVLTTLMNIKGYSIDRLIEAGLKK